MFFREDTTYINYNIKMHIFSKIKMYSFSNN